MHLNLACVLGLHRRNPASARPMEGRYIGECAGCGRPMVWSLSGWKVDRRRG